VVVEHAAGGRDHRAALVAYQAVNAAGHR